VNCILTNTSSVVRRVSNELQTPVRRLTAVTAQTTHGGLTTTLTGQWITRAGQRTQTVTPTLAYTHSTPTHTHPHIHTHTLVLSDTWATLT